MDRVWNKYASIVARKLAENTDREIMSLRRRTNMPEEFKTNVRIFKWAISQSAIEMLYKLCGKDKEICDFANEGYDAGYKASIKEVLDWVCSHQLISPDDDSLTRFEPFYQIEEKELKEWGIENTPR